MRLIILLFCFAGAVAAKKSEVIEPWFIQEIIHLMDKPKHLVKFLETLDHNHIKPYLKAFYKNNMQFQELVDFSHDLTDFFKKIGIETILTEDLDVSSSSTSSS